MLAKVAHMCDCMSKTRIPLFQPTQVRMLWACSKQASSELWHTPRLQHALQCRGHNSIPDAHACALHAIQARSYMGRLVLTLVSNVFYCCHNFICCDSPCCRFSSHPHFCLTAIWQ